MGEGCGSGGVPDGPDAGRARHPALGVEGHRPVGSEVGAERLEPEIGRPRAPPRCEEHPVRDDLLAVVHGQAPAPAVWVGACDLRAQVQPNAPAGEPVGDGR
jgi:hypothetical protein